MQKRAGIFYNESTESKAGCPMEFLYGETELAHLRKKDAKLAAAIDRIGHVSREVEPDLFTSVVNQIVGQQISTAAHRTVWKRFCDAVGDVTPERICEKTQEELQRLGMTFRKADYILDFARKVRDGEFDLDALNNMDDEAVKAALSSLRGIGPWTAEMLMIFCMQRPDVVSYGDLAILRGMRMLYRKKEIDKTTFARCRKRYSPYGTTASLYLWAIAGGALPELTDPAAPKQKGAGKK